MDKLSRVEVRVVVVLDHVLPPPDAQLEPPDREAREVIVVHIEEQVVPASQPRDWAVRVAQSLDLGQVLDLDPELAKKETFKIFDLLFSYDASLPNAELVESFHGSGC